ncbi:4-oxalocrotonate tautomerase DmpI [Orenia marismortui]|uniref:4-oxalocrotonate tautomerase DmpI n=1 Tax=Orenia marismortui TaxID=46469 RepID=UPI000371866B|nr:4-oxalocrotonate tautomerase DmpI [Orenia marismortui]
MPIITMEGPKLTKEQKAKLISEFTKTASEITAIPESSFSILIKENSAENVGVGGKMLSEIKS